MFSIEIEQAKPISLIEIEQGLGLECVRRTRVNASRARRPPDIPDTYGAREDGGYGIRFEREVATLLDA
tara:strand:- start:112 stop:318 length:207 start_codon:yes stop_codon:yes gene_type:complete